MVWTVYPSSGPAVNFGPRDDFVRERAAGAAQPARLLDLVRHAIRIRHYSRRTEEAYVGWTWRFILFHGKRHPREMGEAEVTTFLSSLALERRVSASTQNQALSALVFLYEHVLGCELDWLDHIVRAKTSRRLPVVLTREEVRAVLDQLDGVPRLVGTMLYGSGLRLLEGLRLRIKDVDFGRGEITVRGGKGGRDRRTVLPGRLKKSLIRQLEFVQRQHGEDIARGGGWVELPAGWHASTRMPGASGAGSGCFPRPGPTSTDSPASAAATTCMRRSCSGP